MATNQFLMLDEISMEYHTFRKDQVLTDTQLNELIDFFEDQDRLTRTCLAGVGLVCGLAVDYDSAVPSVTVGKGCGVTTDGDLLVVDATTYKHFKIYDNREKGTGKPIYDPFFPVPDGSKQVDLWELVVPGSKGNLPVNAQALGTFNATTGKVLDDMVALLYLENYLQEPDNCTAIDCDNQGRKRIAKIKVLLLSKADMDKVINRDPLQEVIADSIYKKYHDAAIEYFDLPVLKAKRVILNASNTSSIVLLAKSYTGIVQSEGAKLIKAVEDLYNGFRFMIDPAKKTNITNLKTALQQALATQTKIYHAQYLYDYYKDIITCYNEIRESVFRCMYECCPDRYAFPKHIMLGELKPIGVQPAPYRHEFYPSPAQGDNKDKVAYCRSMWLRMQQLVQQFNIQDQPTAIKITPSTDYDRLLEKRAIPFYYKGVQSIVQNWNYQLSRRGAQKSVLSYHAGDYGGGIDSTMNPLDYNIDANNFFRIEGHLGKQLGDAMAGIDKIRSDKSVAFDLLAIRVNKTGNLNDINIDDFDCQFEDLTAILKAWLIEQNCLYGNVASFFSGFSSNKAAGFHTRIDDYKITAAPVYMTAVKQMDTPVMMKATGIRLNEAVAAPVSIAGTEVKQAVPICRTVYTVDKTIEDNLETNAGSLGTYFAEAVKQPAFSADDMIADVKQRTAADPELAKLNTEEREVVYEAPITMVAHITDISRSKPYEVGELNLAVLQKYIDKMEKLCAYVKKLSSRMESLFGNTATGANGYSRQGYESYYLFLIQQLIANCCAAEEIESLLEEINRRKQKILDSLLLSNYAQQHSGLEHKAGVHRGGTFVLIYAQQVKDATGTVKAVAAANENVFLLEDVAAQPKAFITTEREMIVTGINRKAAYEDINSFAYYLVTNQGKVNFDKEVAHYMAVNKIKEGTLQEQAFNRKLALLIKEVCAKITKEEEATVAANVVIADFTLPYLCCSDCPPMTFIMPKQQYSLSLPKAAACNDEAMLEFRKEPADGTVKAAAGFEAAIVNKDDKTFFDPAKVPAASFGKPIAFTINDQVTDCTITVFKHPVAKAAYSIEAEDDAMIKVVFSNTSDDATGKAYGYEWDFADGNAPRKVNTQDPITITYKKDELNKQGFDGKIPVTLTASNGPCTDTFPLVVPYKKEAPVSLALPNDIRCDDAKPIDFTVQPATGVVVSADVPASVIKTGAKYSFDPTQVPVAFWGKPITFTVNGKPVTCTIKVFHHPKADFNVSIVLLPGGPLLMNVTFTNLSDPANNQQLNYTWTFNDGTQKVTTSTAAFTQQFDVAALIRAGQQKLIVKLLASNPGCENAIEKDFDLPSQQPIVVECIDTVKTVFEADIKSLQDPALQKFLNTIRTTPEYTQVTAELADTAAIIKNALTQVASFNQSVVQAAILQKISQQLIVLYTNKFNQQENNVVITPQVKALLRLALDLVKCYKDDITGKVLEMLLSILHQFQSNIKAMAKLLPEFNKGNAFLDFLTAYLKEMKSPSTQLKDAINELAKAIKATF